MKNRIIYFVLVYMLSNCTQESKNTDEFQNGLKKERIFLDFYLGMTGEEYRNHLKTIDNGGHEANEQTIEHNFFGNIYGIFTYDNFQDSDHIKFSSALDGVWRLVSFKIDILKHRGLYSSYQAHDFESEDKQRLAQILINKYGKPNGYKMHELVWGFPSVNDPKYICELDTVHMTLKYYYNPLFLVPLLEKEKKRKMDEEDDKLKDAI